LILEVERQGDGRITAITRTSWNDREPGFPMNSDAFG
jgi:hypothetical protein